MRGVMLWGVRWGEGGREGGREGGGSWYIRAVSTLCLLHSIPVSEISCGRARLSSRVSQYLGVRQAGYCPVPSPPQQHTPPPLTRSPPPAPPGGPWPRWPRWPPGVSPLLRVRARVRQCPATPRQLTVLSSQPVNIDYCHPCSPFHHQAVRTVSSGHWWPGETNRNISLRNIAK